MAVDEKIVVLTVRYPVDVHERLRRMSFEKRKSMNEIAVQAVDEYLEREGYGRTE